MLVQVNLILRVIPVNGIAGIILQKRDCFENITLHTFVQGIIKLIYLLPLLVNRCNVRQMIFIPLKQKINVFSFSVYRVCNNTFVAFKLCKNIHEGYMFL